MITFENGIDIRAREPAKPTVARFAMGDKDKTYRYIVIGTAYGYLHTTAGDVRTWRSYSGARRACNRYVPL